MEKLLILSVLGQFLLACPWIFARPLPAGELAGGYGVETGDSVCVIRSEVLAVSVYRRSGRLLAI
jgi:hypothetical protein